MDALDSWLTTSKSKSNLLALENLPRIIDRFPANGIRDSGRLQTILTSVLNLTVSGKNGNIAKETVDSIISRVGLYIYRICCRFTVCFLTTEFANFYGKCKLFLHFKI